MIKVLSKDIRNKISAGEVVERPASVVKELIENSIDANAKKINIVVEKGGQQLIQVSDDGCGIPGDELSIAFDRYTTSKINALDDLFTIDTLGFRGEALASIASVSKVNILSANGTGDGFEMSILNGKSGDLQPAPNLKGTSITIRNLFYNTPARKKFLKSPRAEFRKVVEMVRRFSLGYPAVSYTHLTLPTKA